MKDSLLVIRRFCSFFLHSKHIVGEEHFLYKPETAYDGWKMIDLQRKGNLPIGPEKAVEIPENEAAIVLDINDHKAAGYDMKVDIGKVLEIDDSDAKSHFMNMLGLYQWVQFSTSPKRRMKFGLTS